MGVYSLDQRMSIIVNNPQKELVKHARQERKKLMMHLYGDDLKDAMKREDYFENADVYKARSERPMSNKDVFQRILGAEEMVFTARGGTCNYIGLNNKQTIQFNQVLDQVQFGIPLRDWVKNFALSAYRADPMGVILMETAESFAATDQSVTETEFQLNDMPPCYPTYKSAEDIFDYLPNGRKLEYVCFNLTIKEIIDYGIEDDDYVHYPESGAAHGKYQVHQKTPYYRFIDDESDAVYKLVQKQLTTPKMKQKPEILHPWTVCPALIASDVIYFAKSKCFASPLYSIVELADSFLYDRSIRDLQKRYHGFAKAVEPLLRCPTCDGTGLAKGSACPDCTPNGHNKGIGYKIKTKVQDVAKFPLDIFADASGFDFRKIFGYITPDIESWRQQDLNLDVTEALMYYTYWGTRRDPPTTTAKTTSGVGGALEETATKTLANLQPKYARLNRTADWAERTENWIAGMMGYYYFTDKWQGSSITYGRNYILESAQDLRDAYYDARDNGMSDLLLDDLLEKVIRCEYATDNNRMQYFLKLLEVEPFPHLVKDDAKGLIPRPEDWQAEIYFRQWARTLDQQTVLMTTVEELQTQLEAFVKGLDIQPPPAPPVPPPVAPPGAQEKLEDGAQGQHGKKEEAAAAEQE